MTKTTADLQAELDSLIEWFESGDADIDQMEAKYKEALDIAQQITERLKAAENTITKLQQSFEKDA